MQDNSFKGYQIKFEPRAEKEFKKLDRQVANQIDKKLKELTSGALNADVKKLHGPDLYRLRVGDYRVVFNVKRHIITIFIITVEHRRQVYRNY